MNIFVLSLLIGILGYLLFRFLNFYVKYRRIAEIASHLPEPPLAPTVPIIGNAWAIGKLTPNKFKKFYMDNMKILLANGETLMRFKNAFSHFSFPLDGNTVKDLLESQVEISKGITYNFVLPWLGTGLLISTGEKWKSRRRLLTPTFHFSMLDGYVEVFDKECRIMTSIMAEKQTQELDVFPLLKSCALDIICETAMGKTLNAQRTETPYVRAVTEMGAMMRIHNLRPWMRIPIVWYLTGYHTQYNNNLKILTDFTKGVIKEREEATKNQKKTETKRKAFLDMLIEMKETNNFTSEDIREEVDTFMFEGHDTTSAGAAWIVWCLACHPDIQSRVARELFDVFGDSDRSITVEDMKNLPYLELVIKESMRMNPPVPIVVRLLANDIKLGKYTVPAGSNVVISPFLIHNNEKTWPNPEVFDPDRFLPENSIGRNTYDYIPFSAGPRNCIGQKFALYEEKAMISWILRKFELEATRPFLDNIAVPQIILKPDLGVPVKLKPRNWDIL